MAEYRLSPAARADLESIWRHTFDRWGIEQAERYIDTLTQAFDDLAETPGIARTCDNIRQGYRRFVVEKHTVYFRITRWGISIIRVLHVKMDAPRHL
ncbi:MAG TPA: type II toxin-antitoxin system RelE/ParE family toxin [Telluria sp.]|jgi:toxin ParE1/3/4